MEFEYRSSDEVCFTDNYGDPCAIYRLDSLEGNLLLQLGVQDKPVIELSLEGVDALIALLQRFRATGQLRPEVEKAA